MEENGRRRRDGDPRRPARTPKSHKDRKEPRDKDYDRDSAIYDSASAYAPRNDRRPYRGEQERDRDRDYRRHDRHERYDRHERHFSHKHVSEAAERDFRHDRPDYGDGRGGEHRPPVQIVTRPGGNAKAPEVSSSQRQGDGAARTADAGAAHHTGNASGAGKAQEAKKKPQFTVPSLAPAFTRCRLMDEEWGILADSVSPHLLENGSDFTVVACIGAQGVGKSTVLSLLLSPVLASSVQSAPLSTEETGDTFEAPLGIHTVKSFMEGDSSPPGVDMCVSAMDRLILLDAQPLFDSITSSPDIDLRTELYLLIFLASICHTIMIVTDSPMDTQLWKFMRLLATLKAKVPNLATWLRKTQAGEHHRSLEQLQPANEVLPGLLVVFNRMDELNPEGLEVPSLYEPVRNFLRHSLWNAAPLLRFTSVPTLPGASIRELLHSTEAASVGFRLREHLLASGHPRGRFGREGLQLTERQWLYHVCDYWGDYWDFIQKHADVQTYFDIMANGLDRFGWPKPKI